MQNLLKFITIPKVQLSVKKDDIFLSKSLETLQIGLKEFKSDYDTLLQKISSLQVQDNKQDEAKFKALEKKIEELNTKVAELSVEKPSE